MPIGYLEFENGTRRAMTKAESEGRITLPEKVVFSDMTICEVRVEERAGNSLLNMKGRNLDYTRQLENE